MELNGEGYPGSTYSLSYAQKHDALTGYYFHAGTNEIFNVMFSKKKK